MHVSRAGSEPCASGLCVSVRLGDVLLGELLDDGLFVVERDAEFFLEVDANLLHGDRLQVNAGEHLLDLVGADLGDAAAEVEANVGTTAGGPVGSGGHLAGRLARADGTGRGGDLEKNCG